MVAADGLSALTRFGPAVFFTVVALFYTVRIITAGRRLGRSPVAYGRPGTAHHRCYLTFRVFRVLIWLASVARAAWPPFDALLVPIAPLFRPSVMVAGNLVLYGTFVLIVWQNLAMGNGWRSGIPDEADTAPLLTGGIYRRCRHPMAATIMVGQLGLFLAIPSLFTLVCLAIGVETLRREVALEEVDLARRHGERWEAYRATTRKWPWSRKPWSRKPSS
jgi:protein-S-isoprenylcysteine O-methyltransferase Ste14